MVTTQGTTWQFLAGRYRLIDLIGEGANGSAWRAEDVELGRPVAVNELRFDGELDERTKRRLVARMLREAEVMALVCPDRVVTVIDIAEEEKRLWMVTELVEARRLDELLSERGPLDSGHAARIGLELLDVLGAAHREGITHGDVRPSHVLVRGDGRIALSGFGLTVADGVLSSATRMPAGSACFASPERARGDRPGPASDLWSLGAVLYAMVEGRPPYRDHGSLDATLAAVAREPVRAPLHAGPLELAINALLRKDPVERADETVARRALDRVVTESAVGTADSGESVSAARYRSGKVVRRGWLAGDTGFLRGLRYRVRQRPKAVTLGAVAVLTVFGALVAVLQLTGDNASPSASGPATAFPTSFPLPATPAGGSSHSGLPSPSSSQSVSLSSSQSASADSSSSVPSGFVLDSDPMGFSIAIPDGWKRIGDNGFSTGSTFAGTGDPRRLLVDVTKDPGTDPVVAWQQLEARVMDTIPGYQRIGDIRVAEYRGWQAADWEWTFDFKGIRYRSLDRGFVVDPTHGYAIKWSVPESEWYTEANQSALAVFLSSFQPVR